MRRGECKPTMFLSPLLSIYMGCCEDYLTCDIAFNADMPLSHASTHRRHSRIEGVTGNYREKRQSRGHPMWAQPTRTRLGLLARPGGLCPPRGIPQVQPGPIAFLLAHKKSSWSCVACGLRLILISCDVKNMEKNSNSLSVSKPVDLG